MNSPVLATIDAEILERVSRREVIAKGALLTAGLASFPVLLGAASSVAFDDMPAQVADVLNFALTLEYLEAGFYKAATSKDGFIPAGDKPVFDTIRKHEEAHVAALKLLLGSKAVSEPKLDPTAGGKFADVLTNYQTFLALSNAFEDTGVRAYKGQAGNLASAPKILDAALAIHSVEARHASQVRRMRAEKGWITGNSRGSLPEATQPIYDGEDNTTQGGADLAGLSGVPASAVTEAFDEPLTKEEVLNIVKPFIVG